MASISVRNNTNASFYRRHGRRASLLLHPHGLHLLKFYVDQKKSPMSGRDIKFVNEIANTVQEVVREKETSISIKLREILKKLLENSGDNRISVTGEKEESVEGQLSQSHTSGDPDAVIRMAPLGVSGQVEQQKLVMLNIEVSVDKNGGEKKIGQAFDYASLIDRTNETVLLFTFNVDRKGDGLKITQEAFIYVHDSVESRRKMGFLWREVYQSGSESDVEFLKTSCVGIVRCLNAADYLRRITASHSKPRSWKVLSDNVAVENEESVFKVFDNRFHPTYRRPDLWLNEELPHIAELCVEKYLEFEESESIDVLGRPTKKRSYGEDDPNTVSYPRGSVIVIKYKFVDGTHIASKVSHFREIAYCISCMHQAGIVHGDIRGFNMLHPHPEYKETGITKSQLIDFDLFGSHGQDTYPPGYAPDVKENQFPRAGRSGSIMHKLDDWRDLASAMANYTIEDDKKAEKDLESLWSFYWQVDGDTKDSTMDFPALLDGFIAEHGDATIVLPPGQRVAWERILVKGTGSPNKKKQKSRGSTTVDRSG